MAKNILLVHGAWQGKWAWESVANQLVDDGFNVLAIDLPGSGEDTTSLSQVNMAAYAQAINEKAQELSDDGDIILIGHSMGGAAVTEAASIRPDLFCKIVYVCAFVPRHGESVAKLSNESKTLGTAGPVTLLNEEDGSLELIHTNIQSTFFNDYLADVTMLLDLFRPQPTKPLVDLITLTQGYEQLNKAYIICDQDLAISPKLQSLMAKRAHINEIYHLDSGHEPFITCQNSLMTVLKQSVQS